MPQREPQPRGEERTKLIAEAQGLAQEINKLAPHCAQVANLLRIVRGTRTIEEDPFRIIVEVDWKEIDRDSSLRTIKEDLLVLVREIGTQNEKRYSCSIETSGFFPNEIYIQLKSVKEICQNTQAQI